ncbi:MAG: S8 family peptidase [Flavobacteriales bacterium]|nr:S8 family peptidase [Flavobacteriales bacterium]
MNMITNKFVRSLYFCGILISTLPNVSVAQESVDTPESFDGKYLNWYNKDGKQDKMEGASVARAYTEIIKDKKAAKKVVVAIIDSGVDIEHDDLKGKVWTNTDEIPGNGVDDDNNGYIDDVHGWGFLGNSKGDNINIETYEFMRIYRDLNPKFKSISSENALPAAEKQQYRMYVQCKKKFEAELKEKQETKKNVEEVGKLFTGFEKIVGSYLKKDSVTIEDLMALSTTDEKVSGAGKWLLQRYMQGFTKEGFQAYLDYLDEYLNYHLNLDFNPRADIIGDNPADITDRNYGNNDVIGPRADHGTGVAGIVAAVRGNNLGTDGIADNVEIMSIRTVPNGDEYDKDVALAIWYAVDNGANIINMSFGKAYSPQKKMVDDAIQYAEAHNVLLIHAAGNDAHNNDLGENFPTDLCDDGKTVSNWIEVGANQYEKGKEICASFSNYGQNTVDVFAPGVDVITLFPGSKYWQADGTSFAGPVVTGVAALVWSYNPGLTAVELKQVLLESSTDIGKKKVYVPGQNIKEDKSKVRFGSLSTTGGLINAYEALKLAEKKLAAKSDSGS